jgi:uncharacterized surface protein with fasciclin (FAS1) repeats
VALANCKDDLITETSKYDRPDWLSGKLYTQLKSQEHLSLFAKCIEMTGLDSLIDVSGSYSVFAPNDNAFLSWLDNHPVYHSIEDIPSDVLSELVHYHIIQNPWTKQQLMSLDVFGWIDTLDRTNNRPRGNKRETLLQRDDKIIGVARAGNRFRIVDAELGSWQRRIINNRKYAPVFYKQYFDIHGMSTDEYEFYFGRQFESPQDMFFVNGKIVGDEIFAENGFIFEIDRVVEPLNNAYEILKTRSDDYGDFLDFINEFPVFTFNQQETLLQPGASEGLEVDSLFNLSYPLLAFDITNERTKAPPDISGLPSNVTIRYHHGLIAPNNQAFSRFIDEYLIGPNRWGGIDQAPAHIRRIIANTHMSSNPIYQTDINSGFFNGEQDIVTVNESSIDHKEYGSNATFIGVNEAILPRAFSSVTGPVYLQRGYSTNMYAIEESGLLPSLKRRDQNYLLFVGADEYLREDSSLVFDLTTRTFRAYLRSDPGIPAQPYNVNTRDLRTLLLNHIGTELPTGIPRKEFIRNMAGNYIVFNNETGEVRGTAPTSVGYNGTDLMPNYPRKISTNADNGITYEIGNWFSFRSTTIYSAILNNYPHFHALMVKAGFDRPQLYVYSFINENQFYTIFIPTLEAIEEAGANELTGKELEDFILMHFIQGNVIFTDGKKPAGYYETARIDDRSTAFNTIYTRLYIIPGIDVIQFPDKFNNNYLSVNESSSTNITTERVLVHGSDQPTIPNIINQSVIHEIDKAFARGMMNTQ